MSEHALSAMRIILVISPTDAGGFARYVKQGFDECVGITRFTMIAIGIWPGVEVDTYWYSRYYFLVPVFFMIFFINIPQTNMLLLVWGNSKAVLEILTTADIVTGLACLKLLSIWYNKQDLRYLLVKMAEDWKITQKSQQLIMWENVKLCKAILICYVSATFGTIVVYALRMLMVLHHHEVEEINAENYSSTKPMFFTSKFFFEVQSSPKFEITWICQFLAAVMGIGAFSSFDGFFIFSILHLCSQLTNLQVDIKNIIHRYQSRKNSFVLSLKSIVKKHVHLHRFTYCIENNFNKVFLVQMICYSITLCLESYQLVISLMEDSSKNLATLVFMTIFAVANIMSLFLYCFVSEKLRTESLNIFYVTYEINWYELEPKTSRMLLNLMYATKSPLKITAGKFSALSFEYLMKVLKTSAGYLSMLLAVKSSRQ